MDLEPRQTTVKGRADGERHRCWRCGLLIDYGAKAWTWTHRDEYGTARRYKHLGCGDSKS